MHALARPAGSARHNSTAHHSISARKGSADCAVSSCCALPIRAPCLDCSYRRCLKEGQRGCLAGPCQPPTRRGERVGVVFWSVFAMSSLGGAVLFWLYSFVGADRGRARSVRGQRSVEAIWGSTCWPRPPSTLGRRVVSPPRLDPLRPRGHIAPAVDGASPVLSCVGEIPATQTQFW